MRLTWEVSHHPAGPGIVHGDMCGERLTLTAVRLSVMSTHRRWHATAYLEFKELTIRLTLLSYVWQWHFLTMWHTWHIFILTDLTYWQNWQWLLLVLTHLITIYTDRPDIITHLAVKSIFIDKPDISTHLTVTSFYINTLDILTHLAVTSIYINIPDIADSDLYLT